MNTIEYLGRRLSPSKIVCIGRNYVEHIEELENEVPDAMVVFLKPNSAIANKLSAGQTEVHHYEAEICYLFQNGRFIAVGLGIDLTQRELQSRLKAKGLPWERSKAFDGSAVFSSFVPIPFTDRTINLSLEINGTEVQRGNLRQMIYSPETILEEVQSFMTLVDGDVVMTGTPKGVGPIVRGDEYCGRLSVDGEVLVEQSWTAL